MPTIRVITDRGQKPSTVRVLTDKQPAEPKKETKK